MQTLPMAGNDDGFTLVELLVVLALMGLLTSIFLPYLAPSRSNVAIRAATRSLADNLIASRGRAIATGKETDMVIDREANAYTNGESEETRLPQGLAIRFAGPPGEISDDRMRIRFFPDGSSSGAKLHLSAAGRDREVTVHWLTGRVSVDD